MDIAILGCGYVGLELGSQLTGSNHTVYGIRRSESGLTAIQETDIMPIQADVTDRSSLSRIPDIDALVFSVSSGGRGVTNAREAYITGLRTVIDHFGARPDPPDRLVYTSSTGVYSTRDGSWVDESTPISPTSARQEILVSAERTAQERSAAHDISWTIVRLGGIYGPGRSRISRYLSGPVTEGYLNLIHRDDAAGLIRYILLENLARNEIVLGVDDEPVSKWVLADWFAEYCEETPPPKQTIDERLADSAIADETAERIKTNKRCSNAKLTKYGYEYVYPTYREGYKAALDEYCG